MMARKAKRPIEVETLTHDEAKRRNIPTAELQSVMRDEEKSPFRLAYERRNRDLDPQLFWRGKDEQDWSDLVVHAPPLYIQEKLHPKVLIDDLLRQSKTRADRDGGTGFPSLHRRGRTGWGACPIRGAAIPWPLESVFRRAPRTRYHRQPLFARQTDRP